MALITLIYIWKLLFFKIQSMQKFQNILPSVLTTVAL